MWKNDTTTDAEEVRRRVAFVAFALKRINEDLIPESERPRLRFARDLAEGIVGDRLMEEHWSMEAIMWCSGDLDDPDEDGDVA